MIYSNTSFHYHQNNLSQTARICISLLGTKIPAILKACLE